MGDAIYRSLYSNIVARMRLLYYPHACIGVTHENLIIDTTIAQLGTFNNNGDPQAQACS